MATATPMGTPPIPPSAIERSMACVLGFAIVILSAIVSGGVPD